MPALAATYAIMTALACACPSSQVWDVAQCKCVRTLRGHQQPVQRVTICSGRLYSTAGRNIRIWDLATLELLHIIQTQQKCVSLLALAAAPDGTVYAAGQVRSPAPALKQHTHNKQAAA